MLPNGKLLAAGGYNGLFSLASVGLYDPETGTWTATSSLITARYSHTATLLPNGQVLVPGGYNRADLVQLSSTELYDVGPGFSASCQPQIATVTSPLNLGASLAVTGSRFRGVSEASGGNTQDSATDYPLVQLRSVESGQTMFLLATDWSSTSFTSAPVSGIPIGYALATVFVNGIPSTSGVLIFRPQARRFSTRPATACR